MLRLVISAHAKNQVKKYAAYYRDNAGIEVAYRFRQEFRTAAEFAADNPDPGSPRFAHLVEGMDLRVWALRRFPLRIFYIKEGSLLRILDLDHQRRDVTPASLAGVKRGR